MANAVAEFAEVTKTYRAPWRAGRAIHALRGVSFRIEPGEVFALLGPNRAGKTTLLKILLGLCRPSGGSVFRLGQPLSVQDSLAKVGYMHENQAFPSYLTADALLEFYGELTGLSQTAVRARIPGLLERVGLIDRAHEPIGRFSKGMVQRLALAQAILAEPELLVLDEPTEGLDLTARQVLHEIVAQQRQTGRSVLLVTHSLGEVARLCDRLAVLVKGQLAFLGSMSSFLHDPGTGDDRSLESALGTLYCA